MKVKVAATTQRVNLNVLQAEGRHNIGVFALIAFYLVVVVWISAYGFDYYRLSLPERAFHPLHRQLRPSGAIGIRLALLGVVSFVLIYLYALRKRWKWLGKKGKTKNWLDAHIVLGIGAPLIITFHAAFKMRGLAGIAYWIMIAVMLSGIVGRYIYAQIPRQINASELSFQDMQAMTEELTAQLHQQRIISEDELKPLLLIPDREQIEQMPVLTALLIMLRQDLKRPFSVARVRRRTMSWGTMILTIGGLLRSREQSFEQVIDLARQRSWMSTKIAFLSKTHQVFHLWHVVHRPFSYSFAILVAIHIAVAVLMGYF